MSFLRQIDLVDMNRLQSIGATIIGCGSIGSFTAITLAKMGIGRLVLYDDDSVESHNIPNQFFTRDDLGTNKAECTAKYCTSLSPHHIEVLPYPCRYVTDPLDTEIVICTPDNMDTRRQVFEMYKVNMYPQVLIEARMGGEILSVFSVPKDQYYDEYESYLNGVEDKELPCTARTIIYNVLMCSSLIGSLVKKFVNGEDLPFLISYSFKENYYVMSK